MSIFFKGLGRIKQLLWRTPSRSDPILLVIKGKVFAQSMVTGIPVALSKTGK
jgi:hypothetical protein